MIEAAMTTQHIDTSGTLLAMPAHRMAAARPVLEPFSDSLDHIKALELEATVQIAVTYLRRNGNTRSDDEFEPSFPEACRGKGLAEVQTTYGLICQENRRREELSAERGIELAFTTLCDEWKLDGFERNVMMLLLMLNAAPDFTATFKDCDLGKGRNGMEIGTLLAIICDNLRDQLACRRYFSVESTLIRNDLIVVHGDIDDSSNILDETVRIQERFVRFILGDNNLYSTCFRWIKREKSTVNLDQVILPGSVKGELVDCMERYLSGRDGGGQEGLDEFFGYGTALVYLFHGPSGTGKTMMAKALAAKFDRTVFSLSADDMREMPGSYQEIISTLFREAALQNGIVFFDECDDIFEKGSRASRSLLIELEKARCVVILATNRPVELDPALERRISMKTYFSIPESDVRRRIWGALIPPEAILGDDVDLEQMAERYRFTGGLIRNTIFLALTAAGFTGGAPVTLTAGMLHYAAGKQTATLADERRICTIELPSEGLDQIPLDMGQSKRLKNLATVWGRLKARKAGFSLVITASNVNAAARVAKGIAHECGLVVRSFDFQQVISRSLDDRITDPVTQRPVLPIDYAFSPAAGDEAMTLFIDHENMLGTMLAMKRENMSDIIMKDLQARLRGHTGMFCIVGIDTGEYSLPPELSHHERLRAPELEQQMLQWENHLGAMGDADRAELWSLVASHPMHPDEIDFIVRQSSILATLRRLEERPSLQEIREVIERLKGSSKAAILFGGQ